jgi:flavin-dependent dehydrogenase
MTDEKVFDVAVLGGGLAGLTSAIRLSQSGKRVLLLEKKDYPRHKVCGEYVSNEVLPILLKLGWDPFESGAMSMKRFQLSAPSGKSVFTKLPLGAFSISRFTMDYELCKLALQSGTMVRTNLAAKKVERHSDYSEILAGPFRFKARFVIGAFGKTSNLEVAGRDGVKKGLKGYVGVKKHVKVDFPEDLVALHNFSGGYCGVSRVENSVVNICYLAKASDVHQSGGIASFEKQYLYRNPHLAEILSKTDDVFDRPLAISNFTFGAREAVFNGVFMAGDAAGMITPLCGNGMAMAITAGYELAGILNDGLQSGVSSEVMEAEYTKRWKGRFSRRLWWGNQLQRLMGKPLVSNAALSVCNMIPSLAPAIIEQTHGETVVA